MKHFNNKKLNVLLIAPSFKTKGGTQDYCRIIKEKLDANIQEFSAGRDNDNIKKSQRFFQIAYKYLEFLRIINSKSFDVIHINTSLDLKSIARDVGILLIAVTLKNNVIVTFHGWYISALKILKGKLLSVVRVILSKPKALIVLAEEFKLALQDLGIKNDIIVEKTFAPDYLFKDSRNNFKHIKGKMTGNMFTILFLSRVNKEKGIYIAIDSVHELQLKSLPIKLVVAGDGKDLIDAKKYVSQKKINDVDFIGFIEGERKKEILSTADVFILPSYSEGMPISVIEAMASGLPVISRPVGGLNDFFINGIMGFLTKSFFPKDFALYIKKLYEDRELRNRIGEFNYRYAREMFRASAASERLMHLYYKTCRS